MLIGMVFRPAHGTRAILLQFRSQSSGIIADGSPDGVSLAECALPVAFGFRQFFRLQGVKQPTVCGQLFFQFCDLFDKLFREQTVLSNIFEMMFQLCQCCLLAYS